MIRSLERVSYVLFCGGLGFLLAAGLFAFLQWLLGMDVFAFSSLTLFYLFTLLAALVGGAVIGVVGYMLYAEGRGTLRRSDFVLALFSGPVFSALLRLGFQWGERPGRAPELLRRPESFADYWAWLSAMSAYHPPPHGRAWWMILVLSASFVFLLWLQPHLVRRTCARPPEKP